MTTNSKSDCFKLGLYQIIGGGIGVLEVLNTLVQSGGLSSYFIFIYGTMLIFYIYSIICGTLCIKSQEIGLRHSIINQFLQIIGFSVLGYGFSYVAGVYILAGLDLTDSFIFNFNIGISEFHLRINSGNERAEITFNFVALLIIYWIDKIKKKKKLESVFEDIQVKNI